MADNVSMSSLEAVDECFDMLIKSRFIEMFGTLDSPKVPFKQLGDVATYVNGYAFKPTDWGAEGLPIIRIQNLSGSGDSFNYYSGTYPEDIEINKGDVMISWSATLGVFVWNGPKALLNQHIFKVYFDKMEVNPTYFRVAVEPALESSSSKVHGSTMTHLTKKTFDAIKIAMPPIDMQNEFGSFVEQVDKSKTVCKQIFRSLDNLVKSRFIEMFGDYFDPRKSKHLDELTELFIDGDWIESKDQSKTGIRLIQTGNIGVGEYLDKSDKSRFINDETFHRLKCSEVLPGDILISRLPDPIGRACIVPEDMVKSITGVDCTIVRFKDQIHPVFFVNYTTTGDYRQQIEEYEAGSTRRRISRKNLGKILIPVPPIEIQRQFADFVKQVDKSKFSWPRSFGSRTVDFLAFLSTTILSFRPLASLWDSYGELRLLQGIPSILQVR